MDELSKQTALSYLGGLGLLTCAIEGTIEPDWNAVYKASFSGETFCESGGSALMSAVGVLLGGKFPAGEIASKLLYPDNARFLASRVELKAAFDDLLRTNCRSKFRDTNDTPCVHPKDRLRYTRLAENIRGVESKQGMV